MYQPIAFNVIKQALEWHGFPVPHLRQLSYSPANEDGLETAEYLATWGHSLLNEHYRGSTCLAGSRSACIYQDLFQCFMDDVQVLSVGYDHANDQYTALLYVVMPSYIGNWFEHIDIP